MRIQYLGPPSPIRAFPDRHEELVDDDAELGVSYRHRELVPVEVLNRCRFVNVHMSFLPFNRGAHPIYWAAHDGTPPGVSIHWMDEGIDTGPIIAQRLVPFQNGDTLRTSYERCEREAFDLFIAHWPWIRNGFAPGDPQAIEYGSAHRVADLPELTQGWDTPIAEVAA